MRLHGLQNGIAHRQRGCLPAASGATLPTGRWCSPGRASSPPPLGRVRFSAESRQNPLGDFELIELVVQLCPFASSRASRSEIRSFSRPISSNVAICRLPPRCSNTAIIRLYRYSPRMMNYGSFSPLSAASCNVRYTLAAARSCRSQVRQLLTWSAGPTVRIRFPPGASQQRTVRRWLGWSPPFFDHLPCTRR